MYAGIVAYAFIKAKTRTYYAKQMAAGRDMQSGRGRSPSWGANLDRRDEFLQSLHVLSARKGVPRAFVVDNIHNKNVFQVLVRYAGALEHHNASFAEQTIAVADMLVSMWKRIGDDVKAEYLATTPRGNVDGEPRPGDAVPPSQASTSAAMTDETLGTFRVGLKLAGRQAGDRSGGPRPNIAAAAVGARKQIGTHSFRDPDYRQITVWSRALDMSPEDVIEKLRSTSSEDANQKWLSDRLAFEPIRFGVRDGAIRTLIWDFQLLPIRTFEWVEGLEITEIWFRGTPTAELSLQLTELRRLDCFNCALNRLELSQVPQLTELRCGTNQLEHLDLSQVPELLTLWCNENVLNELDLSPVPKLTDLWVEDNLLKKLDPSVAPNLSVLWCDNNYLRELNLSRSSGLTELRCNDNKITKLGLNGAPQLTGLGCECNELAELDLSPVAQLRAIACGRNLLTKLDLESIPRLTSLSCDGNRLTTLRLRNVPGLTFLSCRENELAELDLTAVSELTGLDCSYNKLAVLNLSHAARLTELSCGGNELQQLQLSRTRELTYLWCPDNQLTELDLLHTPLLTHLWCSENRIQVLDIRPVSRLATLERDPSVQLLALPSQAF